MWIIMSCNEGAGEAVKGQRWIYAGDVATNQNKIQLFKDEQWSTDSGFINIWHNIRPRYESSEVIKVKRAIYFHVH